MMNVASVCGGSVVCSHAVDVKALCVDVCESAIQIKVFYSDFYMI